MNNQITNDFDIMELIKALMSMKQQQQPQINPSGMLASLNQSPTQPSPTGMLNALAGSTAAGQDSYQPKRTTPQDQSNWERFTKGGGGGQQTQQQQKKQTQNNESALNPNVAYDMPDNSNATSSTSIGTQDQGGGLIDSLLGWLVKLWAL